MRSGDPAARPLGARAVERGYASEADVLGALKAQYLARVVLGRHLFLGEILLLRGVITPRQLVDLLRGPGNPLEEAEDHVRRRFFGDVAIEQGHCAAADVLAALDDQRADEAKGRPRRLVGEILFASGKLTRDQVADVIARLHVPPLEGTG
jgi:hypothetical protein